MNTEARSQKEINVQMKKQLPPVVPLRVGGQPERQGVQKENKNTEYRSQKPEGKQFINK